MRPMKISKFWQATFGGRTVFLNGRFLFFLGCDYVVRTSFHGGHLAQLYNTRNVSTMCRRTLRKHKMPNFTGESHNLTHLNTVR